MGFIKTVSGKAVTCCYNYFNMGFGSLLQQENTLVNIRTYAKRKGYREMAKKKKVKTVIQKQSWIPHNLRKKEEEGVVVKRNVEHTRPTPIDDVWPSNFYTWRVFNIKEAVTCHRETHHPTIYNVADSLIKLNIELDMSTAKPTRFVEKFSRMAMLPNFFEQEGIKERSVLVFCKTAEQKESAQNAGASLVGGVEIIKDIERGKIVLPDFRFVIAHPSILPEMVTIRGLLKKKFPSIKTGTLSPNLGELVAQFKNGVEYTCYRDEKQLDYGWIDISIGRLNMDIPKIEENFIALVKDINQYKPKRSGPFITRVVMSSPPSVEKLKIDLNQYIEEKEQDDGDSSDEDEAVPAKV